MTAAERYEESEPWARVCPIHTTEMPESRRADVNARLRPSLTCAIGRIIFLRVSVCALRHR